VPTRTPAGLSRAMGDADALLWTIGRDPVLRTTICAVVELERPPEWETVRKRFSALVEGLSKFRSVVRHAGVGRRRLAWVVDPSFDLDLHLRRLTMPAPADGRCLLDLAQAMATAALDPELSPWEAAVVDGLPEGRAALVVKVHHAMVDGLGGMAVAGRLLDGTSLPVADEAPRRPAGVVAGVTGAAAALVRGMRRAVASPGRALGEAGAMATSTARLLAPSPSPLSPVMVGRGIHRRFEVLDLDLALLRARAGERGASVNDVFLNGVLGGLRRYHEAHGAVPDRLRVLMPISVRTDGDGDGGTGTGNRFVPARFALPLHADEAVRLRAVQRVTSEWKAAPALSLSDTLAAGLGLLPPPLATALWGSMLKGTDFCATNVPGPPAEMSLAGSRLERLYAFAPPSGAACNVALVTLAGRACVGVNLDPAAVPDPTTFVSCLAQGFAEAGGSW